MHHAHQPAFVSMAACIDHVIILLPYQDILAPPTWLKDAFTISPGGRHADGRTENRLIIFKDGSYVELIAFIDDDPDRRSGHWWDKPFGIVDYAFTSRQEDHNSINKRLHRVQSRMSYEQPKRGGRVRPDGVDIQWLVTFPTNVERGLIPFWCHDITPRENRVPLLDESTTHPCGAQGIAGLALSLESAKSSSVNQAIAAILEVEADKDTLYHLHAVKVNGHLRQPYLRVLATGTTPGISLVLQSNRDNADIKQVLDGGTIDIRFEKI